MVGMAHTHLGGLRTVEAFRSLVSNLSLELPCDDKLVVGSTSPLAQPLLVGDNRISNRIVVQPMEGWDATPDGRPTESTFRRWARFGMSGAKLVWGGEAVAVRHEGRANPNQLSINEHSRSDLEKLREALIVAHKRAVGSADGLVIGLQLTHSGRYSRPNTQSRAEPRILYRHPILDQRLGLDSTFPILTDQDIREIIDDYCSAAIIAHNAGFDFVDIKHCHGYLGHEFLSAHTREGNYGGSFENRTRFLREVVAAIRAENKLELGVRLSVFDTVPFKPNHNSKEAGTGVPESFESLVPYHWGFGLDAANPLDIDLTEPFQFLSLLCELGISMVNISAGSPYYNPHIQRPAFYPPSDGYLPPEDPLVGVCRQMNATRIVKKNFPNLAVVGSGYSYLQDFLPYVAQAAVREEWTDFVGLGRMILSYPTILLDAIQNKPLDRKKICRTFSDCTTAPRKGLRSGCFPLDDYYKTSVDAERLKVLKRAKR